MRYRNRFDRTGQCSEDGDNAEALFVSLASERGWSVQNATRKEQFLHIDYFLSQKGYKNYSFDVKARKKVKRADTETNDELIWIEWRNVAGNDGWLNGAANYIAFERENDFIIVERFQLKNLCEKIVKRDFVNNASDALYKIYQRKGRQDEISLIKLSDIFKNKITITISVYPKSTIKVGNDTNLGALNNYCVAYKRLSLLIYYLAINRRFLRSTQRHKTQ